MRRIFEPWGRRLGAPLALLIVCGLVLAAVRHLGAELSYAQLVHTVRRMPFSNIAIALAMTALSYLALFGSDLCAARFAGVVPTRRALLLASFCGYALGNATGFGSLSGAAVRYRIYSVAGIPPSRIGQIVAYLVIAFAAGATVVAAGLLLITAGDVARITGFPEAALRWGAAAAVVLFGGLIARWRSLPSPGTPAAFRLRLPTPRILAVQLVLTALDLAAAGAVLWFLLPADRPGFLPFTAVYTTALLLGAVSYLPGGIGVFEAAILTGFGPSIPAGAVAGALVLYRAIYFLLPMCAAAALLAGYEARRAAARPLGAAVAPLARAAARLAPTFLGVLVFCAGAILVFSGATPAFSSRITLLEHAVPLWLVEAANFLGSVAGVVLLFVARGLIYRLDGAWWMALALTAACLLFSLASGLAIGQASLMAFILVVLVLARRQFSRPTSLLRQPLSGNWLVAVALVVAISVGLLFFAYENVQYTRSLWWEFAFDAKAPRALRAVMGAGVAAMALAIWQLLRPPAWRTSNPMPAELGRAAAIVLGQERASANLAMLADKSFLFSNSGASFLMYSRRGRTWVALFDPVGPRSEWRELVWRFIELADAHRGRAAFYQVGPDSLPIYLDAGLSIHKLGEEARVDVGSFELDGPIRSGLRYARNRGLRDGLTFRFVAREEVRGLLPVLDGISAAWLSQRNAREKGFSVARFAPGFVAEHPVALLYQAGRPVAFAGVMTTQLRNEAALSVMRHVPDASRYAMEFLLVELLLELRRREYRSFSLGMSPLAGLEIHPLVARWHRLGHLFWAFGTPLYNFRGLRRFKDKFQPAWEPRYLAATGTLGPYLALADTAVITGGGLKGVFAQ